MTINNSTGKPNWSQRLNPDDPSTPWNETNETCNVTAGFTALITAGHNEAKLNKGLHPRGPMDLLYFMRKNQKCIAKYQELNPKHDTPMNEFMEVLAIAMAEYTGDAGVKYVYAMDRAMISAHVRNGDGAVIHGNFTFQRKDGSMIDGGHYESLAGITTDAEDVNVTAWIVDDPYGNPHTMYLDIVGNDIVLDDAFVDEHIKPTGTGGKDVIIVPKVAA